MHFSASPYIFRNAQKLRVNQTETEQLVWYFLREVPKEYRFRRQHPLMNYIADFYCHALKLVIEVDGGIHDTYAQSLKDNARDEMMTAEGIEVLRIRNDEIFNDWLSIQIRILTTIDVLRKRNHEK